MNFLGRSEVVDPGLDFVLELGSPHLGLGDEFLGVLLVHHLQGERGAGVRAARLAPAVVQQVGAPRAFLGEVEVFVEEDHVVGAGFHAQPAAGALDRVQDDHPVLALVRRAFDRARLDARSLVAVHAQVRPVGHFHLGHGAPHPLGELDPELSDVGLRFGYRAPIVGNVLVFADDLAVMAAVALVDVDDEDFLSHGYLPSLIQLLKRRPEAGS